MFAARSRYPARLPIPIGFGQQIPLSDIAWKSRWPFIIASLIAILMIICIIVIGGLEIGSLAKSTNQAYGNTASIGTGLWCGLPFLAAAVLILMINCMVRTRLWALISFIATIIAICFSTILIGLDAKAVQDGTDVAKFIEDLGGSYEFLPKYGVLAAQLAFACVEFLLCLAFIILYMLSFNIRLYIYYHI